MKKMVCEICESQKIKKENGVFICQECGTEYSVEEAKKLLKEVSENAVDYTESADVSAERNTKIIDNRDQNKGELLKFLLIWANIIKMLEYQKDYKLNLNDFKTWESTDNVGDCISIIHPRKLPFKYERIQTGSSRLENSISYWIDETPLYKSFSNKLMVDPSGSNLSCILLSMNQSKDLIDEFYSDLEKLEIEYNENYKKLEEEIKTKASQEKKKVTYIYGWNGFRCSKKNVEQYCSYYHFDTFYNECSAINKVINYNDACNCMFLIEQFKSHGEVRDYRFTPKSDVVISYHLKKGIFSPEEKLQYIDENEKTKWVNAYNNFLKKLKNRDKELEQKYNLIIEQKKKVIAEIINYSKELSKDFNLPIKYRNSNAVIYIIELLLDGRAKTWQDAINIYEDDKFKNQMLQQMSNISSKLDVLSSKISNLYTAQMQTNILLLGADERLRTLNKQINFANNLDLYSNFGII